VIAYKCLRDGGTSVFTAFRWPLPDAGPGAWVQAEIDPCRSGIHACRVEDLPYWAGRVLYEIELDGEIVAQPTKIVAPRGRLVRRIDAWERELRDAYTRACADRAHELAAAMPAWEATIEPLVRYGPALLGFMAARIAQERGGLDAYRAERGRQAAWLAERL
jgi:hypothetical protein